MALSLRTKAASVIVVILLFAIGANTLLSGCMFVEEYSDALKSRAVVIGEGLRYQLVRLLDMGIPLEELTGFDEQCLEAAENHGLSYAMVLDRNGRILFHSDTSKQGRKNDTVPLRNPSTSVIETVDLYSEGETDYYNVVLPVFVPGTGNVGSVAVGFPTEIIAGKTMRLIRNAAAVAVVSFLLAVFLIFVMFSKWVSHPLGRLLSVIREIREEDSGLTKQVEIESRDEIGKLGQAFNEMITDLRKSQAEVAQYAKHMEQMVVERTLELEKAREELVRKALDAGRAQLSAMVLHNIGNALTPLKIHIEAMRRDNLRQLAQYMERSFLELSNHAWEIQRYIHEDSRGREIFSFMGRAIEAVRAGAKSRHEELNRLEKTLAYISDILTLQQKYAAAEKDAKEVLDINALIEDAVQMQAPALEKRDITVRKDLMMGPPKIMMDRSRLVQVLVNVIKNAYEALDEAGEECKEKAITLRSYREGKSLCLEVLDNGVGIEPEHLPRVCEFGGSRKGSTGVGLYYCRLFVESNRGTLSIRSQGRGKGTSVLIRFPVDHARDKEEVRGE